MKRNIGLILELASVYVTTQHRDWFNTSFCLALSSPPVFSMKGCRTLQCTFLVRYGVCVLKVSNIIVLMRKRTLSLSARAIPLRVFGFVLAMKFMI